VGINIEALCAAPLEALAHSPSQMPLSYPVAPPKWQMLLSCPVAPPSQRELHKDGGGGGDGVARRAFAARAPKAKSCATSSAAPSATPCAASLTCWRRRRRQQRWWWLCGREVQCVVVVAHRWPHIHAPVAAHAPGVDEEGPRGPVRRHWKMAMDKTSTFTPPSCAASFTCPPFTCRPPLPLGLQH